MVLTGSVGARPLRQQRRFKPAHRFLLGDAGVGYAVHVALEQSLLVLGRQIAIMRHALVKVVRDQVKNIFFQIGAGTRDRVYLVATDHLGQRQAKLGRTHRAGQRYQHHAAASQMALISLGGVHQRGSVEVAKLVFDKVANGSVGHGGLLFA